LKFTRKILPAVLLLITVVAVKAQNESLLLPFSNRILLNPAFSGINNQTGLSVGNQYYYVDSVNVNNLLYFTYDTYSDKLKGRIALIFQQGIIGNRNLSTTEFGFAYAGKHKKLQNGTLRFAVNTNFLLATKQLYVYSLDRIMVDQNGLVNPPGPDLFQYLLLKPRFALLWETRNMYWGLTAGGPLKVNFAGNPKDFEENFPANITLYISGNRQGHKKGLRTRPYVFVPELVVFYQEDYSLARFHGFIEHTNNTVGLFIQSDFTHNVHSLGGTLGLARGNIRINLSAGAGIPGLSDQIGMCGELSMRIIVPEVDYSKINPWANH
jgi:hypothetical protein